MNIRKATPEQYQDVRSFYHSMIDALAGFPHTVGWKKDIYPSPQFLKESIDAGNLFIATEKDTIIAAMILNHECNDSYLDYQWPTEAADTEITVIHALGVHPKYTRNGYAKQMVQFAIDTARADRQKVIRLDVLKGNIAAERLYAGLGFRYLHTLPMFYEDTGWTDFELYEYVL